MSAGLGGLVMAHALRSVLALEIHCVEDRRHCVEDRTHWQCKQSRVGVSTSGAWCLVTLCRPSQLPVESSSSSSQQAPARHGPGETDWHNHNTPDCDSLTGLATSHFSVSHTASARLRLQRLEGSVKSSG